MYVGIKFARDLCDTPSRTERRWIKSLYTFVDMVICMVTLLCDLDVRSIMLVMRGKKVC